MPIVYSMDLVDPDEQTDNFRKKVVSAAANCVKRNVRRVVPRGGTRTDAAWVARGDYRLFRTIFSYVSPDARTAAVTAKSRHAHLVHEGTKPHEIAPRRVTHLAIGGTSLVTGPVQHPGAKAQPFLLWGAENAKSEIPAAMEIAREKVIQAELKKRLSG